MGKLITAAGMTALDSARVAIMRDQPARIPKMSFSRLIPTILAISTPINPPKAAVARSKLVAATANSSNVESGDSLIITLRVLLWFAEIRLAPSAFGADRSSQPAELRIVDPPRAVHGQLFCVGFQEGLRLR